MTIGDRTRGVFAAVLAGAALIAAPYSAAESAPQSWRAIDGAFALPIMCRHADALTAFDRSDVSQEALAGLIRDGECQHATPDMGFHLIARQSGLATIAVTIIDGTKARSLTPAGVWWVHEIDVTYFTLPHTPQSRMGRMGRP